MSKYTHFFATREDLIKNLRELEKERKIKYIKCGSYFSKNYPVISSAEHIENLGVNSRDDHLGDSYLIVDDSTTVIGGKFKLTTGETKYAIDQGENLISTVFWPGGMYGSEYLIAGQVATIHEHGEAKELHSYFSKKLVKGFKKVREYYIGPEAMKLASTIRFITICIKEPIEYDLKIN